MYLVRTFFDPPEMMQHRDVVRLREAERIKAEQLQHEGVLVHLWRQSGTTHAWGVWDVDSLDDLKTAMSTLPLYAYMSLSVQPIEPHPNAVTDTPTSPGGDS